mmetsp:Transcript_28473/g.67783  ORF Transcript_28473/g.67783 Transcript_28473/m.67783 type:complete len:295 (-) Transcript_28473:538-1422(-)
MSPWAPEQRQTGEPARALRSLEALGSALRRSKQLRLAARSGGAWPSAGGRGRRICASSKPGCLSLMGLLVAASTAAAGSMSCTQIDFCQQRSVQYIGTAMEPGGSSSSPTSSVGQTAKAPSISFSSSSSSALEPRRLDACPSALRRSLPPPENMCLSPDRNLPLTRLRQLALLPWLGRGAAEGRRRPSLSSLGLRVRIGPDDVLGSRHCSSLRCAPVRLETTMWGSIRTIFERPKAPEHVVTESTASCTCCVPPMCARSSHAALGTSPSRETACDQELPSMATLTSYSKSDLRG